MIFICGIFKWHTVATGPPVDSGNLKSYSSATCNVTVNE